MSRTSRTSKDKIEGISKKYTQFSKKVVLICLFNLLAIELFAMVMIWRTGDTSQISFLVTAIAAECLACVVWYMKNSEGEKKARIQAEIERMKHEGNSKNASIDTPNFVADNEIPNYGSETFYESETEIPSASNEDSAVG